MMKLIKFGQTGTLILALCMLFVGACAPQMTSEESMAALRADIHEFQRNKIASGAEGYMDSVYQRITAGELDQAIKDCEEIRSIRGNDYDAYIAEGVVYHSKGEYTVAINRFSSAIAMADTRDDAYYFRARSYAVTGAHRKALEDVDVAIGSQKAVAQIVQFWHAINNTDVTEDSIKGDMYRLQAGLHHRLGEEALAVASIDKAIEYTSNISAYFEERGIFYLDQQKYGPAYNNFERALELDPGRTNSWNYAGAINLKLGSYNKAVIQFKKAYELDPHQIGIITNYGLSYWLQGDQVKAFEIMEIAMRAEPSDSTYYHIAYFNHLSGHQDKALEYYKKARALNADIIGTRTIIMNLAPGSSPTRKFYKDELETAKLYIETGKTPAAVAYQSRLPRFEITGITLIPDPVPVNKRFDFQVSFDVDIPGSSSDTIPTVLYFNILRGSKVLHTSESYSINANNGGSKKWVLHMNPVRAKGSYTIQVTIKYNNMVSEKSTQLLIN